MTNELSQALKDLPKSPGVYFHKDAAGAIIYIGKAAVLRNRVRQYFQKSRGRDPKTEALVAEIAAIDIIETESEIDALFLEAEMVRRYMPRYNILLRDDKALSYVRIDEKSDYPTVTMTRRPLDDGATYYGPFVSSWAVKRALKYLRRIFPFSVKKAKGTLGSKLYEQIGLDPGLQSGRTSLNEYRSNLRKLGRYLKGEKKQLIASLEKDMKRAARKNRFEDAARLRNQLLALEGLKKQIIFSDKEFMDISKDKGLAGLAGLLGLTDIPRRIEGYDISHQSGTDTVASMVVFASGLPDKAAYRKFKSRIAGNDDFTHMHEVITRRLSPKNQKDWGLPNLFLIDGGKGQLSAAMRARDESGLSKLPMIGLAKREEEIVVAKNDASGLDAAAVAASANELRAIVRKTDDFLLIELPKQSDIVMLLQRIRDESHRFAVSYHSTLKRQRQTTSWLDEIPTIGPATRKKLIRHFGSVRAVTQARHNELENILGVKKATILRQYIRAANKNVKQ